MSEQGTERRWRILTLVIASALCLAGGEIGVRLLLPRPGWHPFPPDVLPGMILPHPTRQYQYAPDFHGRVRTREFDFELHTNNLGLRDGSVDAKGEESPWILALGDSFTFGFGLQADEAWPSRLQARLRERRPRARVINAGVSAYGLQQIRLFMMELIEPLQPDMVVVGVYPEAVGRIADPFIYFHGYVVVGSRAERMQVVEDGMLYSSLPEGWSRAVDYWLERRFYLGAHVWHASAAAARPLVYGLRAAARRESPVVPAERGLEPLIDELDAIRAIAAEASVPLTILLITPQKEDGSFDPGAEDRNAAVARFCRQAGLPVADPLAALRAAAEEGARLRNRSDYHWSPEAQDLAAQALATVLEANELLPAAR